MGIAFAERNHRMYTFCDFVQRYTYLDVPKYIWVHPNICTSATMAMGILCHKLTVNR